MTEIPYHLVPSGNKDIGSEVLRIDFPVENGVSIYRYLKDGFVVAKGSVAAGVCLGNFVLAAEEAFASADSRGWNSTGVSRSIMPPLKDAVSGEINVTTETVVNPEEDCDDSTSSEYIVWTNCVDDRRIHETDQVNRPLSIEELDGLGFDATGFSFMRLDSEKLTLCYAPADGYFEAGFFDDNNLNNPGLEFVSSMIAPCVADVAQELGRLVGLLPR